WFPIDVLLTDSTLTKGGSPRVAFNGGVGPLITYLSGASWQQATLTAARYQYPSFVSVPIDLHPMAPTSLPGSQADRAANVPLAVARPFYRFAGRAYAAWVQSAAPAATPAAGVLAETEPDDTPPTANGVTVGIGHVAGSMTSNTDVDVFSIPLQPQQHL